MEKQYFENNLQYLYVVCILPLQFIMKNIFWKYRKSDTWIIKTFASINSLLLTIQLSFLQDIKLWILTEISLTLNETRKSEIKIPRQVTRPDDANLKYLVFLPEQKNRYDVIKSGFWLSLRRLTTWLPNAVQKLSMHFGFYALAEKLIANSGFYHRVPCRRDVSLSCSV